MDFEEMEEYRSGKGASKKEIILRHYSKCLAEGSKAMSPGGIQTRYIDGKVFEIAVPNQIEIYCNHVEHFRMMLNDEFKKLPSVAKNIEESYKVLAKLDGDCEKEVQNVRDEFDRIERKRSDSYTEFTRLVSGVRQRFEDLKYKEYRIILTHIGSYINFMNWFEEDSFVWEPGKDD